MKISKILAATGVMLCLSTATIAQINPDHTSPPPPNGAVIPTRDNTAPNRSMDTSARAHRKPVKSHPKEPNYDGKAVTPRGTISKKDPEQLDKKDVPK